MRTLVLRWGGWGPLCGAALLGLNACSDGDSAGSDGSSGGNQAFGGQSSQGGAPPASDGGKPQTSVGGGRFYWDGGGPPTSYGGRPPVSNGGAPAEAGNPGASAGEPSGTAGAHSGGGCSIGAPSGSGGVDGAADDEAEGGAAENGAEGGAAGASAGPASARTVWDAEVWLNRGKSPESHQHIHLVLTPTDTGLSVVTACQAGNQLRARERAVPKLALDGKDTQASLQFLCEQRIDGELNWHAVDLDSDGTFDRIEGSGTGIQYLPYADGFDSIALQGPLELVALPDTSAPKLLAPNLDANPVDVVALYPSEPIEASSRLTLTWNGARRVLRGAGDSMSTAFSSELILPFGSTWDVRATGRDLAGHAFEDPSTTLMMMIDPGVFPQDGFEGAGADRVSLSGPAQIVSRLGTLPALSGAHSLLLRVGSEATLHLVRGDCARHLRFDARVLLSMDGGSVPAYRVDAGVIGGSARPHDSLTGGDGIKPTGDPTWRYEGTHAEYGLDLDEPGRDIVVRFKIAPQETCWPRSYCQGQVAILIDDVRME